MYFFLSISADIYLILSRELVCHMLHLPTHVDKPLKSIFVPKIIA